MGGGGGGVLWWVESSVFHTKHFCTFSPKWKCWEGGGEVTPATAASLRSRGWQRFSEETAFSLTEKHSSYCKTPVTLVTNGMQWLVRNKIRMKWDETLGWTRWSQPYMGTKLDFKFIEKHHKGMQHHESSDQFVSSTKPEENSEQTTLEQTRTASSHGMILSNASVLWLINLSPYDCIISSYLLQSSTAWKKKKTQTKRKRKFS